MPYKDKELRKQKHKEYSKKHYEANKTAVKAKTALAKKAFRVKWQEFKATQSCVKCGLSNPSVIDFHHVTRDPSNRKLYDLVHNNNFRAVFEELRKCVPLCANCHRIHHHEERLAKKAEQTKTPTF